MKSETIQKNADLLVVEDDPHVAGSLERGLREEGFSVAVAGRLAEADEYLASRTPALVVLDLNLPDGDGRTWLRRVRREGHRMPVVILTARDTLPERVAGLEEGADDYLTKPFAFAELLARIRARLRTVARQSEDEDLRVGDLDGLARSPACAVRESGQPVAHRGAGCLRGGRGRCGRGCACADRLP